MSKQEILKHLMELFPVVGHVEGEKELKMKIVMKYGGESKEVVDEKLNTLDEVIEELKDQGVLNEFEFNNTINYKAKKDIPISLDRGRTPTPSTGDGKQLKALSKLVVAMAKTSDDPEVQDLLKNYTEKYS